MQSQEIVLREGQEIVSREAQKIVSRKDWITARKELLEKEKEFTRLRDQLSDRRRQLPWVKIDESYEFEGQGGTVSLSDLFDGRSQLIIYHFMFGPDWDEGCPSCSYIADHFDGAMTHLNHRDVTMVVVSRTPFERLDQYRKRMAWNFRWLSSLGSDFNFDYHVSFTGDDPANDQVYYNYRTGTFPADEAPGISAFYKAENGDAFHTYSCYGRGLDMLLGAYHIMDLTAKGRNEANLPYPMTWVRRHDQYGSE
jgi:predicted dithiol-disulfide oxidoreductase (DUF899 family)